MTTEQSPNDTRSNDGLQDGLLQDGLSRDSAATQPPFIDEHDFNIRLADNDNYDGLTFEVIEAEVAEGKQVVSRGVYLAPNPLLPYHCYLVLFNLG